MRTKCQKCGKEGPTAAIYARVQGWRIWSGTTLGGAKSEVCFCPGCFGATGGEQDPADPGGWDAMCETCNACMSDDGDATTEDDAETWAELHECEPETVVIPPKVSVRA